jgi:uncharacterized protein YcfL
MARRLLLVLGVLLLTSCSSVCGPTTSLPTQSSYPNVKVPGADATCNAESTSHSLNSNTPTSFTITNKTTVTLTVFWLDFQGRRVKYFDLAPGVTKSQGTYITHPWVVADSRGGCVRLFFVTDPTQITMG